MRFARSYNQFGLIAVCLIPIAVGCREHRPTLKVELLVGFTGPVSIGCGLYDGDLQTIKVNAFGQAGGVMCSKRDVDLVVERGGTTVAPDDVVWAKAGDGIPVSLSFQVR